MKIRWGYLSAPTDVQVSIALIAPSEGPKAGDGVSSRLGSKANRLFFTAPKPLYSCQRSTPQPHPIPPLVYPAIPSLPINPYSHGCASNAEGRPAAGSPTPHQRQPSCLPLCCGAGCAPLSVGFTEPTAFRPQYHPLNPNSNHRTPKPAFP